jgi:hypothetical protein
LGDGGQGDNWPSFTPKVGGVPAKIVLKPGIAATLERDAGVMDWARGSWTRGGEWRVVVTEIGNARGTGLGVSQCSKPIMPENRRERRKDIGILVLEFLVWNFWSGILTLGL